jgi:hypothetical protein
VTSAAAVWSLARSIVVLLLFGAKSEKQEEKYKRGAFYSELPSSRDYPEDPVRLEVRVPTVGKPSKSEDSDTQGARGAKRCRVIFEERTFKEIVRR